MMLAMLNFKPDWTVATGSETFKYYAAANPVSRALMLFLQGAPISSFDAFSMVYSTYRMLCSSRPKNQVFHIIAQFYNMKRLAIPSGMHKKMSDAMTSGTYIWIVRCLVGFVVMYGEKSIHFSRLWYGYVGERQRNESSLEKTCSSCSSYSFSRR